MWVTLESLREVPMPVTVDTVTEVVSDRLRLTDEQRSVPSHNPKWSYVRFQLGFLVSDLKGIGALDQPGRGLYRLTDDGREISREIVAQRHLQRSERSRERRRQRERETANRETDASGAAIEEGEVDPWEDELLERLMSASPKAFEHLAGALLLAAGFDDVEVTGRGGDGGIDGIGTYRPSGLISFHTAFQCKRYKGSVGSSTVRDFRGSFIGRSDRGIIITTGSFTRDARDEAARPGANPVDLIDGEALCELLKEHRLGVRTEMVEQVTIDESYFAQFEDRD